MELDSKEKDRIIAEEKLRMETRKEYMKEHFGGMGWRGRHMGWNGGCCHRGMGFLRGLVLVAALVAIFHCWHRGPYGGPCGYYPPAGPYQAPPVGAPPAPTK